MIRTVLRTALACSLVTVTACETTETSRIGGHIVTRNLNDDEAGRDLTEEKLLEMLEENPESAKNWWRLGAHYEKHKKYMKAISAYQELQAVTEKMELKHGTKYVGALYLLGKCYVMIHNDRAAISYLRQVLALQPKDMRNAIGVPDFAEAHYLLGAIYYEHRLFDDAEKHLVAFGELRPGDRRADTMLIGIEDAARPEKRSWYANTDDAPQRPAAKINTTKKGSARVEGPEKSPKSAPEK
jgi:tetratricopeptide (TPR) repeat protein